MDNLCLNSPFSLHFLLCWFQGPDWKPPQFSACCRFRWSHPSQTPRQRGIIWCLQPRSFSPHEVIHTHTFPIISPAWFPFNTFDLTNAGSVDSKLITASTHFLIFLRGFSEGSYEFQNKRGRWWAAKSPLLKKLIQHKSPARNLCQNQLLHCKCLHNTDPVCFTTIINTVLELTCEYHILCPKPKLQLWRIGINLPWNICCWLVFFPACLQCYCIFFLAG